VKGDAIAGLLITFINLVGGLAIGMSRGMPLAAAAETFSILSVGDALVSQIPALLISTAAGVVVTRSATGDQLGRAFKTQLLGSRRAVTATAGVLTLFALLPGMPALPFLAIAGALFWVGRQEPPPTPAEAAATAAKIEPATPAVRPGSPEDIDGALPLDVLALEVGYELVQVVDPELGGTLVDRIGALRKQIAVDLGTVIPPVHIRDNLELLPGVYRILLLGTEVARGTTRAGRLLAMDPTGSAGPLDGEAVKDPAFGTPARWIHPRDRELAEALGATVVDHTTIVATHLGEVARSQAHKILGRAELQHLFDVFSKSTPKLVEDLVPNLLSATDVLKVLRNLLRENVSIRDLRSILEGLIELAPATRDTEQLTELARQRLSRQISAQYTGADDVLAGLVLDAPVEEMFRRSLREIASGTGGALNPEHARLLGLSLESAVARMVKAGRAPCVISSPDVRRYVRAFAERRCPQLAVISFREIEPDVTLKPFETITLTTSEAA
jgi:flagellar biosynthesis protein FlhA